MPSAPHRFSGLPAEDGDSGTYLYRRFYSAERRVLGRTSRNKEDVVGLKRNILGAALENLFHVHRYFGSLRPGCCLSKNARVTRCGYTGKPFRQREGLEYRNLFLFAENEAAGAANGSDHVYEISPWHGDHVIRKDIYVFMRTACLHCFADVNFSY